MARKRKHTRRPAKGHTLAGIKPIESTSRQTLLAPEDQLFRLLDLPDELVITILGLVVVVSSKNDPIDINLAVLRRTQKIKPTLSSTLYSPTAAARLVQPAVTRTCSMLRCEGLKLFYGCNSFYGDAFEDLAGRRDSCYLAGLRRWFDCVGMIHTYNINHLYIDATAVEDDFYVRHLTDDLAGLLRLPGCQAAHVRCGSDGISLMNINREDCYHLSLNRPSNHSAESEWRALEDVIGSAKMLLDKGVTRGHPTRSEVWQEMLAGWSSASASTPSEAQEMKF